MTTAFVTGASGFIGGHLVERLVRQGVNTRCLVRSTSNTGDLPTDDIQLVRGDICRPETLVAGICGADVVYHLAGVAAAFTKKHMRRVNVCGTYHVVRQCALQPKPPVLVLVSSVSAAGTARRGAVRTEQDPPCPVSQYGRSKRAAERIAEQFAGHVPTTIVRPGIVFGPRDRDVLKTYELIARIGVHPLPGYLFDPPLSLIHVSDLVHLLMAAADRGSRIAPTRKKARQFDCGYYFAVADEHPSYLELGTRVAKAIGRRWVYPLRIPEPMMWLSGFGSELVSRIRGKPDIFNLDKVREAMAGSWACSSDLARVELGWSPAGSLDQRLSETAQWYRQSNWL
jgi:nucleoside-diphosphate-sugar epimerase